MSAKRFLPLLFFLGSTTCVITLLVFCLSFASQQDLLIASYSYQGPKNPVPGNPQLIRIELIVRDSPEAGGPQIKTVIFNDKEIQLKPRDIYGGRGTAGFQLSPGKYNLSWTVQRDLRVWPRFLTHEEEVTLDPRDLWLQIEIVGDDVSIR